MKTIIPVSLLCVATLFVSSRARADVIPPEVDSCRNKAAGDACTYQGTGVCQGSTCSKLDYSNWDRDASAGPPTTTYSCLKCVPGTASGTSTQTNTATTSPTATATNTNTRTTSPTATATDTDTTTTSPTATATDTDTTTTSPTATATDTDTTTTSPTATATDTDTATTSPSTTTTNTKTGTDTSTSADGGWCSVGKGSTVGRVAPWLMAAAFSLLFLFGRRRRPR